MPGYTKGDRASLETLRQQLENERSSFIAHWQDLASFILPTRPRFFTTDVNKGKKRYGDIIDSTAPFAARSLRSGMMGGITSPARPWFRLTTHGPSSIEDDATKWWLHQVTTEMQTVFVKSNLYNALPIVYGDLGVFGTAAMYVEEDFDSVMRFYPFPIGSYTISTDHRNMVNVFMRDFQMTVRQVIEKFGIRNPRTGKLQNLDTFSQYIVDAYNHGNTEQWVDVVHCVLPNPDYVPESPLAVKRRFYAAYYEKGFSGKQGYSISDGLGILRESGHDIFPVLCPRWETTGGDIYGTNCPGMVALGDVKQLQLSEKRIAQAIEKMVNPPMVAPISMRNSKATILSGDVTYVDAREGQQGFRPAHEVNARVGELEAKNEQVRARIQRAFYEDLFLMMATSDRREITAREIDERHEEKLLALGPVLEQLNQDLLDPLIDLAFSIMNRQGLVPPPPLELVGEELKVEYISIMAQVQRAVGLGGIERISGFVGQVAQLSPDVLDKLDIDQVVDVYGDMNSIPPGIIRSDEHVAAIRQQRAQAQQQAQLGEVIRSGAETAMNLSKADLSGNNALSALVGTGGG